MFDLWGVPYDALHDLKNLDMANNRRIIEVEENLSR
jgi:hypothetical protein